MPENTLNPGFVYCAAGIYKTDMKMQTINTEMKGITCFIVAAICENSLKNTRVKELH